MTEKEFKARTKQFALRVIRLSDALPRGQASSVIGRQLLRSATSYGANYRAACRRKSKADMLVKLAIVEEETDEITAMVVASIKTLRACKNQQG